MKFRWRIKGLLVFITLAAIFLGTYRVFIQPVSEEKTAVRRFTRKWNVSTVQQRSGEAMLFEGLTWPEFLDPKRCTALFLQKAKPRRTPAILELLQPFKMANKLAVDLTSEVNLAPIKSLPRLQELRLSGKTTTEQLMSLQHCPELSILNVTDLRSDEGMFHQVPAFPKLKKIQLGEFCINLQTYQSLVSRGIEVEHFGIIGTFQRENYIRWGETYAALDLGKCNLTANVSDKSDRITWQINAVSKDKLIPQPAENGWHFLSSSFLTEADWQRLEGYRAKVSDNLQDPEGYIYDGQFVDFPFSSLEIKSVSGYRFHVIWNCQPDAGGKFKLNANIPLEIVIATVGHDEQDPQNAATKIMERYFSSSDFGVPEQMPTGRLTDKKFVFTRIKDH